MSFRRAPPLTPIIIDIEASGFGPGSYPIEIGIALPDRQTHCYLIRPAKTWNHWDRTAEAVHGISREILERKGRGPDYVAYRINELLAGQTAYTDAWGHDLSWLGQLHEISGIPQLYRLETLRHLLTEEQTALWHPTKAQVIEDLALSRHRASTDALILQETYRRIRNLTEARNPREYRRRLQRQSS